MKLMIVGSMQFLKDMKKAQKELKKLGHDALIPLGTGALNDKLAEDLAYCIKHDIIRRNFVQLASCDGILVLNMKKNDIEGYIGVSALMELGIAHYLEKKIFLFNPTPHYNEARWAHEVAIMQPVILNGDLIKIK